MNQCFPLLLLITLMPLHLPASPVFIDPNPVQPFHPISSPRVNITTTTTIPAQSDTSSPGECPLDLPTQFFTSVKSACTRKHKTVDPLKCCPVLAAWLYSAYSATALGKQQQTASYYNNGYDELPLLPNDSESCVQNVENGLKSRGIELMRSNESCDVVYCECGIRLHHPLTCTESFSVNSAGDLIGNHRVKMLEKNCLNNMNNHNNAAANAVCSKCLKTLHLLKKVDIVDTTKVEERTSKMHNEDCELMGLTWLLAKNRSAYIHTVSAVLRATMMSTAGNTIPESCTLNSDGMPLAVDSSEINDSSSSSSIFNASLTRLLLALFMFCVCIHQLFDRM